MQEVTLNKSNFVDEVINQKGLVLVDFWASWCGPCMKLAPIIKTIAEEDNGVKVGKVNVDEAGDLAQAFRIESIPTLILFKDGKPVKQMIGFASKAQIEKLWK